MDEFLPLFKKKPAHHLQSVDKGVTNDNIFFQIIANEGKPYIEVANEKGEHIEADYHQHEGVLYNILRTIDKIRSEQQEEISWGEEEEEKLYLDKYPQLLYQLLQCNNIINEKLDAVTVKETTGELCLYIEKDKNTYIPHFELKADKQSFKAFTLIAENYAFEGKSIYPIKPVGENYSQLHFFISPFAESMFDKYLSVIYSYLDNVKFEYEDYTIEHINAVVKTQPTIIFEKVDTDQALYLRVVQGLDDVDPDFLNRFDLNHIASIEGNRVTFRKIEMQPNSAAVQYLHSTISKFAPNKTLVRDLYEEDGEFILPVDLASPFLVNGLPELIREFRLVGAEKLVDYKLKAVKPKLNISLGSGIDFFEGKANIEIGEEVFTLAKFLQQYRKNKYIQLNDGNKAIIDSKYINKLERLFNKSKNDNVKVSFFDLPEIEQLLEERVKGSAFEHTREVYEGFNKLSEKKVNTKTVKAKLRPYQEDGVKWIEYLYENNLGGCLADDMGLGKTLQTITVLSHNYPKTKKPALIVMPKSLLFNWNAELQKFAPKLKAYTYYANNRDIEEAMKHHIILTTYAIVRNDIEQFKKQDFDYIILDESQNIKNVSSQTTQAISLLKGKHRLALSGTPIENNLTELYSLFRFLNPAMFGSLEDFNSQYTYPIQKNDDKDTMWALRRKIFPFMLRRLKKDVLTDLPDRIDQMLYVEMERSHTELYESRRQEFANTIGSHIAANGVEKSQMIMFQALNELRRLSSVPESLTDNAISSPKIPVLMDTLTEAVENGHKVVVFFNYIAGIELVGEKLEEAGIDYTCMTGSTNDRQSVVNRFQNDQNCKVLLMTLKTGGVGLNLTAADTVIIFEPWWNKAAEEQAINRLHRFGQKATVLSYSIITQGTIEEKIYQLQQQKAELFEGLIGSDNGSSKSLSEEDIKFILG